MVLYDPEIIQEYANRLYHRARFTVILLVLVGGASGALITIPLYDRFPSDIILIAPTSVLAIIGFLVGRATSLDYRFKAQTALCQVSIEKNTRQIAELRREEQASPKKALTD